MLEALVYIYGLIYGFIPVFCKFSFKSLLNVEIAVSQIQYIFDFAKETRKLYGCIFSVAVAPEPESLHSGRSVRRADGRDTEAYMYTGPERRTNFEFNSRGAFTALRLVCLATQYSPSCYSFDVSVRSPAAGLRGLRSKSTGPSRCTTCAPR